MDMIKRGRVALLMPVYNAPEDCARSLQSLQGQIDPRDIFLVDDGSRTPLQVGPEWPVNLIRLEQNAGIVGALNAGLQEILRRDYTYVARLDAGDTCVPERLGEQVAWLDAHPDHALLGGWANMVDLQGGQLFCFAAATDHEAIRRRMYFNSSFIHPTVMMRTDALRAVGGYDRDFQYAEDYELFTRLMLRYKVANLGKVLLDYEINPGGISLSRRRDLLRARLRVQWRYRQALQPLSWLGMMMTLVLMAVPNDVLVKLKSARGVAR